ncbi:MAG: hypothetical protein RLZZ399_399 [Verrucomicrobiota bacterium]
MDVAQVLHGSPFPEKLEFPNNHVFGWRKTNDLATEVDLDRARQPPCVEGIPTGQIDVCFEASLMVDDVDVTALGPRQFRENDLFRGQ